MKRQRQYVQNLTHAGPLLPHELGKLGARDHTNGTEVTNFKRSTELWKLAMSYNREIDRDKDRIVREKA